VLDLPPQAQEWARAQGIILLSDLAAGNAILAGSNALNGQVTGSGLSLTSPADRSVYRIDPGFPLESQRIKIEAASHSTGKVTLWVDNQPLAVLDAPPYAAWWQLTPGEHSFWATQTDSGLTSTVVIITVNKD
jgi:hypothetical protein